MKKIYKVVKVADGKRVSAILHYNSKFLTEYGENITTTPPIGKLFAFNSIENAEDFAKLFSVDSKYPFEIWEASGENASKPRRIHWVSSEMRGGLIINFWDRYNPLKCLRPLGSRPAPDGALICDSIKLIRLVEVVERM